MAADGAAVRHSSFHLSWETSYSEVRAKNAPEHAIIGSVIVLRSCSVATQKRVFPPTVLKTMKKLIQSKSWKNCVNGNAKDHHIYYELFTYKWQI